MRITRNSLDTNPGPGDWFTGGVYIDTITTPTEPSRVGAASVHFTPGARTAWHTHPFGQTIFLTEGVGLCQRRGGPIEAIRAGDRVFFEPGEEHWHGAAPNRLMTHIAMHEADDAGSTVTWGAHVTDEEYRRRSRYRAVSYSATSPPRGGCMSERPGRAGPSATCGRRLGWRWSRDRPGMPSVWIDRRRDRPGWGAMPEPEDSFSYDLEFGSMAAFADAVDESFGD